MSALLLTMAAMAGGSILGSFFVSDFYTGGVAAEADNCILLEIMIIVISFNDDVPLCNTFVSPIMQVREKSSGSKYLPRYLCCQL